jgi:hypothetical protein
MHGMISSAVETRLEVRAETVSVTDHLISVKLVDGRVISVPTDWYPRLKHATKEERGNFEIDDYGVTWPEIEADFSIRGLLLGHRSGENPQCLRFWLQNRKKGRRVTVEEWLKSRRSSAAVRKKGK